MTAAAAIGLTTDEIDVFLKRLDKIFAKFKRKHASKVEGSTQASCTVAQEGT